jgi:hypothetical protein
MSIYTYAGLAYLFTAIISLLVIATIVGLNKIMNSEHRKKGGA